MFAGSYCGDPPTIEEIASRWNGDPVLLAALALAFVAAVRLRSASARIGVALLGLAFVSPLCAASVALFAARSVHHLLLILAAFAFSLAIGSGHLARWRVPVVPATLISTAVLWGWHVPAAYDAALANMLLYWIMQATILTSALGFWIAIRQAGGIGATVGLVGGAVQMGFLGALLTFATQPLYLVHVFAAPAWGLSGLEDQQLAGLIMWVGGMIPFALAGGIMAARGWRNAAGGQPLGKAA